MQPRDHLAAHRDAIDPAPRRVAGPSQRDLLRDLDEAATALGEAHQRLRDTQMLVVVAAAGGFAVGLLAGLGYLAGAVS